MVTDKDLVVTKAAMSELQAVVDSSPPGDRVGEAALNTLHCIQSLFRIVEGRLPTNPAGHSAVTPSK
jgi:hypothetical protein